MFTMVGTLKGYTPFFEEMIWANNSLAFIICFTTTFVALMYLVVFGLILAALTNSYRLVKQQMFYHNTVDMQDYEMINFTMRRFKRWLGITKPKPVRSYCDKTMQQLFQKPVSSNCLLSLWESEIGWLEMHDYTKIPHCFFIAQNHSDTYTFNCFDYGSWEISNNFKTWVTRNMLNTKS